MREDPWESISLVKSKKAVRVRRALEIVLPLQVVF